MAGNNYINLTGELSSASATDFIHVNTYADLPSPIGLPDHTFRYVDFATGSYLFFNKKNSGLYETISEAWTYAGDNERTAANTSLIPDDWITADNLQDSTTQIVTKINTKSDVGHTHTQADITDLSFLINISTISSNTSAVARKTYFCDTSGGSFNLTLPTPTINVFVTIKDIKGTFNTNNLIIIRNGSEKIENIAANRILNSNWSSVTFMADGTNWFMF